MTEAQKSRTKVHVINFAKLAAVLGAVATAISGYTQVRKDQNNLLEVMSDKVDAIVLKVAYLEGRLDGLAPKEAAEKAEERIQPAPVPPPEQPTGSKPTPAAVEPSVVEPAAVDSKLYQKMPRGFDAIQQVVERKILELDRPVAAAAPSE